MPERARARLRPPLEPRDHLPKEEQLLYKMVELLYRERELLYKEIIAVQIGRVTLHIESCFTKGRVALLRIEWWPSARGPASDRPWNHATTCNEGELLSKLRKSLYKEKREKSFTKWESCLTFQRGGVASHFKERELLY